MNQYLKITPDIITVNEFTSFNQEYTITYTPMDPLELYEYVFYDVVVSDLVPSWVSKTVKYIELTTMSFSIEGSFYDVFDRTLNYLRYDNSRGTATKFSLLPPDYAALYQYIPSTSNQMMFTMNVRMRPLNIPWDQLTEAHLDVYPIRFMVQNNWTMANQYFTQAVKNAGWARVAAEKGLT
jgi:hypothetical protein